MAEETNQIARTERDDRFLTLASRLLGSGFRLASLLLGTALDAEAAVRGALLGAWSAWPQVHDLDGSGFTLWFEGYVLYACRDPWRRGPRIHARETTGDGPGRDPLAAALRVAPLGRAFLALPAVQREALVLRYCGGRSEDQLEEELHAPAATIAADLRAGLAGLFGDSASDRTRDRASADWEWREVELTNWFASLPGMEAPASLRRFLEGLLGQVPEARPGRAR